MVTPLLSVEVLSKLMLQNLELDTKVGTKDSKEIIFLGDNQMVHLEDLHLRVHLGVLF
jgi:hypothetical protein